MGFWGDIPKCKDLEMKNEYFELIKKNNIANTLDVLEDLSYSKKFKIIETLLKQYNYYIINDALYYYEKRYIETNRILIPRILNQLKYFCNLIKEG